MNRPLLHFTPTKNWMNDPNGFIYYKGVYHLFYQHFPYDTKWGTMHWGHKVSKDLVHWEDLGIALYPSKAFDRNGCFSGSAIEVDGKLYLYYTGIIYSKLNEENIHVTGEDLIACQALLVSEDGKHFSPDAKQVVVPTIRDNTIGDAANTRDPKVWKENDTYYMVLGSQYLDGENKRGEILIYTSKDGKEWSFKNRITEPSIDSDMWECPDLFFLENQYALIMSPENIVQDGVNYPSQATISRFDFDPVICDGKIVSKPEFLDYGLDLYAPQTTVDENGNRVMIAWLRMPSPSEDGTWCGVFTYPRIVTTRNQHFYFSIHPKVDNLFQRELEQFTKEEPVKISVDMTEESEINIGGFRIWMDQHQVCTERKEVFPASANVFNISSPAGTSFRTPKLKDGMHLDIYIDHQVIEIYANKGEYVLSNVIYYLKDELEVKNVVQMKIYGV
ncbi:MAG: glycoside hydrolase family 32 protein [Lachnospiraceae bacterium]